MLRPWNPATKPPKLRHLECGLRSSDEVIGYFKDGRQRMVVVSRYDDKDAELKWHTACSERWDVTGRVLCWKPLEAGPHAQAPAKRLKVLPLDYWMDHVDAGERAELFARYQETEPRMKRPGVYKQGKVAWFETSDGLAFRFFGDEFDYKLRLYNAERLSPRKARALRAVVVEGLATQEQQRQLRDYLDMCEIRQTGRNARKYVMQLVRQREAATPTEEKVHATNDH